MIKQYQLPYSNFMRSTCTPSLYSTREENPNNVWKNCHLLMLFLVHVLRIFPHILRILSHLQPSCEVHVLHYEQEA